MIDHKVSEPFIWTVLKAVRVKLHKEYFPVS